MANLGTNERVGNNDSILKPVTETSPLRPFGGKAAPNDFDAAYQTWAASPRNPPDNAAVLDALMPTIERSAKAQVRDFNPLMRSRARQLAYRALQTYDPSSQAKLQSHLHNHLQGLKRHAGRIASGVRVPEGVMLDRRAMASAEAELVDELGRDPTDDELSDRAGFSHDRIKRIRQYSPAMSTGYFQSLGEQAGEESGFDPAVQSGGNVSDAWMRMVYDDLPPQDKLVFEHTMGWNGKPALQNQEIARKMSRSPGWVSRRKLAIQKILDREQELSPFNSNIME